MACCAEEAECPMHASDASKSHSQQTVSQEQADSCCAFSEGTSSGPSNQIFAVTITPAVLGAATLLAAETPALVLSNAQRSSIPLPSSPVPKHVLLSVFLV